MNYIVFDLEWNQSSTGREAEVAALPFEIVEIGAVKLNCHGFRIGEFGELIKPAVYHEMNQVTCTFWQTAGSFICKCRSWRAAGLLSEWRKAS